MKGRLSWNQLPRIAIVATCLLAILAGCATVPYRTHPQFEQRVHAGMRVALLPPDVKVYEISAGEVPELIDEWSAAAQTNVTTAVSRQFPSGGMFTIMEFDPEQFETSKEEYEDARALFRAVSLSAALHTYPDSAAQLETKMKKFEYSLGPLPQIRESSGADAVLFIQASDQISSGGRVARNVAVTVVGALFGVIIIPSGGISYLSAALVDVQTGDVLWFSKHAEMGAHDLRKPDSADSFVAEAFEAFARTFPAGRPGTDRRQ